MPNNPEDGLVNFLNRIFGDTIHHIANVKNLGGYEVSDWLIPTLIQYFNVFMWVISGIILSAVVIWQIGVHAARAGEQNKNKILTEPIKTIGGIFLLMPTAFGFNIVSLLVIVCALWGIQGGNGIYEKAITQQLKQNLYIDASYFIKQKVSLEEFGVNYLKSSYCAKILSKSYNKSYGYEKENNYSNIKLDANNIKNSQKDVSGKYTQTIEFKDLGEARVGGGQNICGSITYSQSDNNQTSFKSEAGSAGHFASGGLLGRRDEKFNEKFNQISQDLRIETFNVWNDQAKILMDEIDKYIDETLPLGALDEKYKILDEKINQGTIQKIIISNKNQLAQRLSQLSTNQFGYMQQLQKMYINKMSDGGLLEMIGYRQHFSSIRKYIISIMTDTYIISEAPVNFNTLPQDSVKEEAISIYSGVNEKLQNKINQDTQDNQDKQNSIAQNQSTASNDYNCPISTEKLLGQIDIKELDTQQQKITTNQIATLINIILGRQNVKCMLQDTTYTTNQTNSNSKTQSDSLDRLAKAGEIMKIIAVEWEKSLSNINKQAIRESKIKGSTAQEIEMQNTKNLLRSIKIKQAEISIGQLKSAGMWINNILPNILDFFLIIAIALLPLRILLEMIAGTCWSMTLFIPSERNWIFPKQAIGLILYIPAIVVGYFSANVILNYVLEFAIGMTFESMQYTILNGDTSITFEDLKTQVMIFVVIGGAVTIMCASLILALPNAVNKILQAQESEIGQSGATTKLDTSGGSANAQGMQAGANVGNQTKAQNVLGGTDFSSGGNWHAGDNKGKTTDKNQAPAQLLNNTTDVPEPNIQIKRQSTNLDKDAD